MNNTKLGCIISAYSKNKLGYAQLGYKGKVVLHHRLVYCLVNNLELASIAGLVVMHSCDTPGCINPSHLQLGTQQDNMTDKVSKRRQAGPTGELHGKVKLTADQVLAIRTLYAAGRHTQADLANIYPVTREAIRDIILRKRWKHI